MLRDPTIEDFAHWVQFHLDKAIKSTHDACHVVERRNHAKGLLRSGNNIIECFDAAYGEFDKGVEAALGELRVAMVKGVLDKTLLRETVEMQMRQFALDMKHASKAPLFREWGLVPPRVLDEKEGEFDKKVQFALRHFDVGHLSPPEPEVPASMKNEIKIDQMNRQRHPARHHGLEPDRLGHHQLRRRPECAGQPRNDFEQASGSTRDRRRDRARNPNDPSSACQTNALSHHPSGSNPFPAKHFGGRCWRTASAPRSHGHSRTSVGAWPPMIGWRNACGDCRCRASEQTRQPATSPKNEEAPHGGERGCLRFLWGEQ
jgi:hypothetical protein